MKYPRTLHLPFSLGTTSDDRFIPDNYCEIFANFPSLVITEKLDGENNCFKKEGLFSRSHTSPTIHPWTKPLQERWELIKNDLGDIELFGEGMFGIHSIEYSKLESYYYVFAVRNKDTWLSWEEVEFYATMFDFPTVPVITSTTPLNLYPINDEKKYNYIVSLFKNLKNNWKSYVDTEGQLGGFDPITQLPCCEGLVIRNSGEYKTNNNLFPGLLGENEMDNVVKLVRKKHVKTDIHWQKTWRKTNLIDYSKYKWESYSFMLQNK